jgi:acyl-CoA thioesterase-1
MTIRHAFLLSGWLLLPLVAGGCGSAEDGPGGAGDAGSERASERRLFDAPAPGDAEYGELPAPPEIPSDAPTVAFLGDSICAGLHLSERRAFPVVLQRRLAGAGLPFRLVSSCESGRTTAGGRTALDWVLRSRPDLVVIELGGNDGLRGIELGEIERNLRALVEGARKGGARVLLLGVRLPPNYGSYGERFDAIYPRLADEYGLAFVPFFMEGVGGNPDLNLADGLHPSIEGQERLADKVLPALRQVLSEIAGR